MWLDKGYRKSFERDVRSVIKQYYSECEDGPRAGEWINPGNYFENPWFKPTRFFLSDENGAKLIMPASNDIDIWVNIEADISESDPDLTVGYALYTEDGILLYWTYQKDDVELNWPMLKEGRCILSSKIPRRYLNEGSYKIELIGGIHFKKWIFEPGINSPHIYLFIKGGLSDSSYWMIKRPGLLAPVFKWVCK
jgi:lipopolysaccharide transport system ATP-binding protein